MEGPLAQLKAYGSELRSFARSKPDGARLPAKAPRLADLVTSLNDGEQRSAELKAALAELAPALAEAADALAPRYEAAARAPPATLPEFEELCSLRRELQRIAGDMAVACRLGGGGDDAYMELTDLLARPPAGVAFDEVWKVPAAWRGSEAQRESARLEAAAAEREASRTPPSSAGADPPVPASVEYATGRFSVVETVRPRALGAAGGGVAREA